MTSVSRINIVASLLIGLMFAQKSIASPQSEAFLKQTACRNFVRHYDGRVLLGTDKGLALIEADGTSRVYDLGGSPRDALLFENEIVALVNAKIITLNRTNGEVTGRYETQAQKNPSALLPQENPRAIGRVDQTLLVAHGTLGVALFDLGSRQLKGWVNTNRGQKILGMAQDIVTQDHSVYILIDNYQMNPLKPSQEFRGFVMIDLATQEEVDRIGGLDPGATAAGWYTDTLLVSFAGMPIWKFTMPL